MESDILNELFDLMELRAEGESAVKDLIDYIKNHKHYEVFLEAMADVRRDLFVDDEITTGKTVLNLITELEKCNS